MLIKTLSANQNSTSDRYKDRDILLREFAHGVNLVSAESVDRGFKAKYKVPIRQYYDVGCGQEHMQQQTL